jgi:DUF1680 family protein
MPGFVDKETDELYIDATEDDKDPVTLKFIPYFAFANRGETDMLVWIRRN